MNTKLLLNKGQGILQKDAKNTNDLIRSQLDCRFSSQQWIRLFVNLSLITLSFSKFGPHIKMFIYIGAILSKAGNVLGLQNIVFLLYIDLPLSGSG